MSYTIAPSSASVIQFNNPQDSPESFVQAAEAWLDRWHEDPRLSQSDKNLCTRVYRHFNRTRFERTGELLAWPGWATLMAKTGLCKASVFRRLRKLEKLGALKIQHGGRDAKTGWKLPNRYQAIPLEPGCRMKPGQVSFSTKTRLQDETRLVEERLVEKEYSEPSAPPSAVSEKEKGLPAPSKQASQSDTPTNSKPSPNNPLPPISARPPSPLLEWNPPRVVELPSWQREQIEAEATLERYRRTANGGGQ